ncbi:putative iron-regulated membrane protein [Terriglobus roseus DSM 18391]|uniref:Putative iron-regulated membrane protein n=1 Tax=Terriglobus roseus (strain DSM 18391 / NRRL B-41598 / KBS 63) TaxID=926566 RepID=I3ZEC5_TERRK|nr:PepSY domain-containing protein [Terriglobus roseus]AFL87593.1 putative iron-regulated membrane protein [Terriglobus roseus DSM 18391]
MSNDVWLHDAPSRGLDRRTVWRWHFYAGLFCIPFVLWLSVTGTVFLFHPQIQRLLDRPYDRLSIQQRATANAQVQAALSAVPGSTLDSYELPHTVTSAAQVLVDKEAQQFRVYVHPQSLAILKIDDEDHRVDVFTSRLHGELLLGNYGSWIVELAGSWAVVVVVTGLFLWWPRDSRGLGGVLYPRTGLGGRAFWKDIHSVTGIYVSFFALFLLLTGLPWAKSWGGYLKAIRHYSAGRAVSQDWTTSSADVLAARAARSGSAMHDMASMPGHDMAHMGGGAAAHAEHAGVWGRHATMMTGPNAFVAIDTMVATVAPLHLANPVLIAPPLHAGGNWTAKSDTRDRPLRVDLALDGSTGDVVKRTDFHSKPWLDRVIGTGIAAHEGQLFGLANQLVSLFTTIGLVLLSVSGLVMWWKRKPEAVLGAPVAIRRVRFSAGLIAVMLFLGLYFPFLGASMIVLGLAERFVLRRLPATQRWLGLRPRNA